MKHIGQSPEISFRLDGEFASVELFVEPGTGAPSNISRSSYIVKESQHSNAGVQMGFLQMRVVRADTGDAQEPLARCGVPSNAVGQLVTFHSNMPLT